MNATELGARYRVSGPLRAAAGVRDLSDTEVRDLLGHRGDAGSDLAGIAFTVRHPLSGEVQGHVVRLSNPPTNGGKYLMEQGLRWLFVAPAPRDWVTEPSVTVVLVEGPKSTLALAALGERTGRKLVAVAMGGCWGWRRNNGFRETADGGRESVTAPSPTLDIFAWDGRDVVIALDGDARSNPRVAAARRKLAQELAGRGAAVRIAIIPPEAGDNGGPDDAIELLGDDAVLAMFDTARLWQKCAIEAAEAEASKLQSLTGNSRKTADPREFVLAAASVEDDSTRGLLVARVAAAKLPGVTKAYMEFGIEAERAAAAEARGRAAEATRRGKLLGMDLDAARLLTDLERFFSERAYLPKRAATALALWALFTWCSDEFQTAPYICLESAIPGCGKSTVLDLLEAVCARGEQSAAMTKALLARTIEKTKATMLFDQAEALRDKQDETGIVAILLSGYRRGKPYRCLVGDSNEPGEFDVFGPKAFCAVGGLQGALFDRCIALHMEKKPESVELESAEPEDLAAVAAPLRERMEAFALKASPALEQIRATRPKGGHWKQFDNRERQLWTPLLSIARACGPGSEEKAVAAAESLSKCKVETQNDNPKTAKVVALAEVLAKWTAEKFSPGDLVSFLAETEAWGEALAEKLRKDDTGKAAANLVGYLLRDFKLQSRERPHGKTLYATAEALAKAKQHMPHIPKSSAASAAPAAGPINMQVPDAADQSAPSAATPSPSAADDKAPEPAAADAPSLAADALRETGPSAANKTRANCGVAAHAADAADKTGIFGVHHTLEPQEVTLWEQ